MKEISFGSVLTRLRKSKALTQRELARALNIHITTIKNWEGEHVSAGRQKPLCLGESFPCHHRLIAGAGAQRHDLSGRIDIGATQAGDPYRTGLHGYIAGSHCKVDLTCRHNRQACDLDRMWQPFWRRRTGTVPRSLRFCASTAITSRINSASSLGNTSWISGRTDR